MPSFDDLRFTLRSLARTPGFAITAIVVLAVGIGLNVSLFTVVNALLLQPLGGKGAGELVGIYSRERAHPDSYRRFSYPEYAALRDHASALPQVLAHEQAMVGVTEGGASRRMFAALVSANYFSTLAVAPTIGRGFRAEDQRVGAAPVAVVSDALWRQLEGSGQPAKRSLRVNGRDVAIVGVAPPAFSGATALFAPDLWLPLGACAFVDVGAAGADVTGCLADRERRSLALVARLKPGVSREAATASLAALAPALAQAAGERADARQLVAAQVSRLSIGAGPSGDSEVALVMLFLSGLALSVLLIASLNLANMLLARATGRQREIAIRLALGSGRARVVSLLLAESGVIALAAAALGLAFAVAATHVLALRAAGALPFRVAFDAAPDARVLGATLAFALVAGLGCGVGPALALARSAALSHLRDQAGQTRRGAGRMSLRNALVVAQLAVSLALLTAAGLFTSSALAAARSDAGFPLAGGVVASVSAESSGYGEIEGRQAYARALTRLRAHPDIASASIASAIPFGLDATGGGVRDAGGGEKAEVYASLVATVGADYFRTLRLPLLRGREFTETEEAPGAAGRSVIVDQVLAMRLWPGRDPIGQQLQLQGPRGEWLEPRLVVGVSAGSKESLLDTELPSHVYLPAGAEYHGQVHLHVRTRAAGASGEGAMVRTVRDVLRATDPSLALLQVNTLCGIRDGSLHLVVARAGAGLFAAFGLSALLLAALGVYGVKSYLVSRRAKEISIRMALGATRGDVLRMVAGDGAALTACGLAVGLALSDLLTKVLAGWVYGAGGAGFLAVGAASMTLGGAALLASYAPVRRATARNPWTILRAD